MSERAAIALPGRPRRRGAVAAGPWLRLALLGAAVAGVSAVWLLGGRGDAPGAAQRDFILHLRLVRLAGMMTVGAAVGVATQLLQTVAANRVLTPSMLGFDALYALIQTALIAVLGVAGFAALGAPLRFGIAVAAMAVLGTALVLSLLGRGRRDLGRMLLGGIILGVLFRALAGFLTRAMDPAAFAVVQGVSVASFARIDPAILPWAAGITALACAAALALARVLDVLAIGRGVAVSLGVRVDALVIAALVLVAVLVSTSTALVGPMALFGQVSFLGLIVVGLAHAVAGCARHAVLIPAAMLVAALILVTGQLVFERVLDQAGTMTIVIEFAGGLFFLFLLLKGRIR